jgi:Carboxypeptidase regulatory-like domain
VRALGNITATFLVAAATSLAPGGRAAGAQGVLTGRVTSDSGVVLSYAGVRIPELDRFTQADSNGVYRFDNLRVGAFAVIAEAPGFRARREQVAMAAGVTVTKDFTLVRGAHVLAAIDVRAKAPPRVSPKMVDFERRRQRGLGKYVTRVDLDRYPGRQLEEVLRSTAVATQFIKAPSGQTWLISSRQSTANMGMLASRNADYVRDKQCHVQVVLDGAVISSSTALRAPRIHAGDNTGGRGGVSDSRTQVQGGDDAVDLNLFISDQLEGVEFYPDATTTPMQYRTGAAVCGTLILWTRDK